MGDQDIQIGGGGGRFGHPDPEITGCPVPPPNFFGPSGLNSFVYKEGRVCVCVWGRGGVGPRAPSLDPPLDYSFESSQNYRHKSSLTGTDQYLLPRTAFIKNGARLCLV